MSEPHTLHGYENLSLREFWKCVSAWANAHPEEYRTMLWVIGSQSNKDGDDWFQSIKDIQAGMREAYLNQGRKNGYVPAYSTMKKYIAALKRAEVLKTEQTRYKERGKWKWGANYFWPNFDLVMDGEGNSEEWNFLAPIMEDLEVPTEPDDERSPCVAPEEPLSEPPKSPRVATTYVCNQSINSESKPGLENQSSPSMRSAQGWSALKKTSDTRPKTAKDLEKRYGLNLEALVNKYTLDIVRIVLDHAHFEWKETVELRQRRNTDLWLAWLQAKGGYPWLESRLEICARNRREAVNH